MKTYGIVFMLSGYLTSSQLSKMKLILALFLPLVNIITKAVSFLFNYSHMY